MGPDQHPSSLSPATAAMSTSKGNSWLLLAQGVAGQLPRDLTADYEAAVITASPLKQAGL